MNPFILNQTIVSTVRYPCAEKAKPVESSDILSGMRFDAMNDNLSNVTADLQSLAQESQGRWRLSACGVTAGLRSIPALADVDAYAAETGRRRIALVSGLSGNAEDAALGLRALQWAAGAHHPYAGNVALTGVPLANPEGRTDLSAAFPPQGNFFYDADAPETRYLWRWLCFQAPDLALEIRAGDTVEWQANAAAGELGGALGASGVALEDSSLSAALGRGAPDNLGPIPGLRLDDSRWPSRGGIGTVVEHCREPTRLAGRVGRPEHTGGAAATFVPGVGPGVGGSVWLCLGPGQLHSRGGHKRPFALGAVGAKRRVAGGKA